MKTRPKHPSRDLGRTGQPDRRRRRDRSGHRGRADRYDFSARLAYLRESGSASSSCSARTRCHSSRSSIDLVITGHRAERVRGVR